MNYQVSEGCKIRLYEINRNKLIFMNKIIPSPFNPEEFRNEGHKLVDTLADYLHQALNAEEKIVLPWNEPDNLANIFSFDSGSGENESFQDFIGRILKYTNHLHHPHYIGHQVTSPLPLTALIQLCTSLLNNGAAIYEMGPVAMAMERNLIKYFSALIGYRQNSDGIFTHGGSAGNLTAMLAIRQNMSDYNIWEEGVKERNKPGFMVSDQSHYSIARNAKIMGLGDESLIRVPYDAEYRMKVSLLDDLRIKAEDKGIKVVSVVANSCSTATGTYDDLNSIADFCEKHGLWLHADGAHGAGVLFSEKYKDRIKGIARADSVVIDFHKMLLVPGLNTMVIFRNGEKSYETFAQKASYLFKKADQNEWYNSAKRTLECTKSAMGIVAYTAVKYYGTSYYREYIDSRYDLAVRFAEMIEESPEMELALKPEANIICFRYAPVNKSESELNRINSIIRDRIIKEGSFYLVQTELEDKIWLRTTLLNPVTDEGDLKELIQRIIEVGRVEGLSN
jgi:L-2,4-diaminobutyrate decarboxylase